MIRKCSFFLLVFAIIAVASDAWAHAQLMASVPEAGAVLPEQPPKIILQFNEPVSPVSIKWIAPGGEVVALPTGWTVQNDLVEVEAPAGLARGSHLVSYRVMSADGHPIGGTLTFSIGTPSMQPSIGAALNVGNISSARLAALGRLALTVTLVFGIGGVIYSVFVDRGTVTQGWARSTAIVLSALTFVTAPAALVLQGLDIEAMSFSGVVTNAPWRAALAAPFATTAAFAVLASALGIIALRLSGDRLRVLLGAMAWLLAAASFAASGHAATGKPQFLTQPALMAHAAGIIFWLGGLLPLLGLAMTTSSRLAESLTRFSKIAVPLVALTVFTGIGLAIVQVEDIHLLWSTSYGCILMAKMILVACLIGYGAANRFILTPAIVCQQSEAAKTLVKSIGAELVLVVMILALAAGFRLTPPPRAIAAADRIGVSSHLHHDATMAQITLHPGRAGPNELKLMVMDGRHHPIEAKEVSVIVQDAAKGIEPIRATAREDEDGTWRADAIVIPLSGAWIVRVDILISDFEMRRMEGEIQVRP